jgi:hypothetical protein
VARFLYHESRRQKKPPFNFQTVNFNPVYLENLLSIRPNKQKVNDFTVQASYRLQTAAVILGAPAKNEFLPALREHRLPETFRQNGKKLILATRD